MKGIRVYRVWGLGFRGLGFLGVDEGNARRQLLDAKEVAKKSPFWENSLQELSGSIRLLARSPRSRVGNLSPFWGSIIDINTTFLG